MFLYTALAIPDLSNTLSDSFVGANSIITNFWPVVIYFLAIGIGFWVVRKVISLFHHD